MLNICRMWQLCKKMQWLCYIWLPTGFCQRQYEPKWVFLYVKGSIPSDMLHHAVLKLPLAMHFPIHILPYSSPMYTACSTLKRFDQHMGYSGILLLDKSLKIFTQMFPKRYTTKWLWYDFTFSQISLMVKFIMSIKIHKFMSVRLEAIRRGSIPEILNNLPDWGQIEHWCY